MFASLESASGLDISWSSGISSRSSSNSRFVSAEGGGCSCCFSVKSGGDLSGRELDMRHDWHRRAHSPIRQHSPLPSTESSLQQHKLFEIPGECDGVLDSRRTAALEDRLKNLQDLIGSISARIAGTPPSLLSSLSSSPSPSPSSPSPSSSISPSSSPTRSLYLAEGSQIGVEDSLYAAADAPSSIFSGAKMSSIRWGTVRDTLKGMDSAVRCVGKRRQMQEACPEPIQVQRNPIAECPAARDVVVKDNVTLPVSLVSRLRNLQTTLHSLECETHLSGLIKALAKTVSALAPPSTRAKRQGSTSSHDRKQQGPVGRASKQKHTTTRPIQRARTRKSLSKRNAKLGESVSPHFSLRAAQQSLERNRTRAVASLCSRLVPRRRRRRDRSKKCRPHRTAVHAKKSTGILSDFAQACVALGAKVPSSGGIVDTIRSVWAEFEVDTSGAPAQGTPIRSLEIWSGDATRPTDHSARFLGCLPMIYSKGNESHKLVWPRSFPDVISSAIVQRYARDSQRKKMQLHLSESAAIVSQLLERYE